MKTVGYKHDSAGQIIVIFMHISGQNLVSFATLKLQSKKVEQYNIYFPLLHLNYNLKKWSIIIFFSTHLFVAKACLTM